MIMSNTVIKPKRDPKDSHAVFIADLPREIHYPNFSIDSPVPFAALSKGGVPHIKVAISGESVLYQSILQNAGSIPIAFASVARNPLSAIAFYHQQYGAFTAAETPGEFQRQVNGGRTTEILKFSEAGDQLTFTIRHNPGENQPPLPDDSVRLRLGSIQASNLGKPVGA